MHGPKTTVNTEGTILLWWYMYIIRSFLQPLNNESMHWPTTTVHTEGAIRGSVNHNNPLQHNYTVELKF